MRQFGSTSVVLCIFLALSCDHARSTDAAAPTGADSKALLDSYEHEIRPMLAEYCFKCHGNGKKKGGVKLDDPLTADPMQWNPTPWVNAIQQIKDGNMPPEEAEPQPTNTKLGQITRWFTQAIATADRVHPRDPGFVALHRLNRNEFNNTVRDLTGLDFYPAEDFPADDSGYGFDNIADVLSLSPLLMEKYLETADQIVDQIIKDEGDPKEPAHHPLPLLEAKTKGGIHKSSSELGFYSNGDASFACTLLPGKEYVLHVHAWQDPGGDQDANMAVRLDETELSMVSVNASRERPRDYGVRFTAKSANQIITVSFTNDFYDEKYKDPSRRDRNLYADRIELHGPVGVPPALSQKRVFIAAPSTSESDSDCAGKIIKKFATRAFRRPVKDDELNGLLKLYSATRKTAPFAVAVGAALKAVLVSPYFLFRVEDRPAATVSKGKEMPTLEWMLSDYEIATRMSYFLWSTMPDDELFSLASQEKLKDPKTRADQVKRMLKDSRSSQLVKNFAGQWLELRNLDDVTRDGRLFKMFNDELVEAMKREAELFFESVMKEDRNIMTFVDSDYTFVNERLAKVYGIQNIKGDDFQRVTLKDSPLGGVITMSSTMTLTANPTRTSPVKRGKWVLEHILGTPPPPPPPEVPPLQEASKDVTVGTVRQRLEQHRKDPNCAACHVRMDGIGFSLENFDPIGRWRDKDGNSPVDAKGEMPGAEPFNGPRELKALMVQRREGVVRNFVQKMMTFALGRGIKPFDRPAVNEIVQQLDQNGDRFSSVVIGIVNSDAFLKRREKRGDE